MQHKQLPLAIKSVDDDTGTFTGLASVFDNLDAQGDIVRRGAFAKSLQSGQPVPLLWEHKADDPVIMSAMSLSRPKPTRVC